MFKTNYGLSYLTSTTKPNKKLVEIDSKFSFKILLYLNHHQRINTIRMCLVMIWKFVDIFVFAVRGCCSLEIRSGLYPTTSLNPRTSLDSCGRADKLVCLNLCLGLVTNLTEKKYELCISRLLKASLRFAVNCFGRKL